MTSAHMALVPQMRRRADTNPAALARALFRGRQCDWVNDHCAACAEAKAAEVVVLERGGCTYCGSVDHPGSNEDDCQVAQMILTAISDDEGEVSP